MTVTELEVNVGVTKNIGNFESLRLDYTMRKQVYTPLQDKNKVLNDMRKELKDMVVKGINEMHKEYRHDQRGT